MTCRFSPADRSMFATAYKILGGAPVELLRSRLVDGVFGDDACARLAAKWKWGRIAEPFLRKAGMDELGMLPDLSEAEDLQGEPAPSARILRSLRAALFGQTRPGPDLWIRAGLHRLGRATADLEALELPRVIGSLPSDWALCAQAAWFRLSRMEECRSTAATLRGTMASGGEA
jgi:hypothetical protein